MYLKLSTIAFFSFSIIFNGVAQISEGEGEKINLPSLDCDIFLPKYFSLMNNGSGVIHNTTGSFVTVVKIPSESVDKIATQSKEATRDMLVDERMQAVEFKQIERQAVSAQSSKNSDRLFYEMKYQLESIDFERINVIVQNESNRYLIVANYTIRYKDQVKEEIDRIIESINFK